MGELSSVERSRVRQKPCDNEEIAKTAGKIKKVMDEITKCTDEKEPVYTKLLKKLAHDKSCIGKYGSFVVDGVSEGDAALPCDGVTKASIAEAEEKMQRAFAEMETCETDSDAELYKLE